MPVSKKFEQAHINPSLYRLAGKHSKPVTGWYNYIYQRKLQMRLRHLIHAHNSLLHQYYDLQKENEELKDIWNDIIKTFDGIDDSKVDLWSENQDLKERLDKLKKDINDKNTTEVELYQTIKNYRNRAYEEETYKTVSIVVNVIFVFSIIICLLNI